MEFSKPLIKGKLIRRYKRFFIDVKINKKKNVTAHCPNTGSMRGLLNKNNDVYLVSNNDPKKKLKYGLEIIKTKNKLIAINTHRKNRIVQHALENNLIKEFKNCDLIKREVLFNENTRFDFLITKGKKKYFLEIKNVTLFRDKKVAEFPDTITKRGSKHLINLIEANRKGFKSYLLFLVQIPNVESFKIAKDLDMNYYKNYLSAKKAGVNFLAYRTKITLKKIYIEKKINIINTK